MKEKPVFLNNSCDHVQCDLRNDRKFGNVSYFFLIKNLSDLNLALIGMFAIIGNQSRLRKIVRLLIIAPEITSKS